MDLNADFGEGGLEDASLMPYLTSCSIACGGHFGTKESITKAITLAQEHGVAVGAHPAYPDPENFGRYSLKIPLAELQKSLASQLELFAAVCQEHQTTWQHIKPHGALYNDLAKDEKLADAVLEVFATFSVKGLFLPAKMPVVDRARKLGFCVWEEVFADRQYRPNGNLVSRSIAGAVLSDIPAVLNQVTQWVEGGVKTHTGSRFTAAWDTLCLHSDTPNAVDIARALNDHFSFKKLT